MDAPEQGQLVQVRNRHYFVEDTHSSGSEREVLHRVSLECVDDDAIGEQLEVLWEREAHAEVFDTSRLPSPDAWDTASRFDAFRHAINWSTGSMVQAPELQAPFHGAIDIEDYQLVPVARALAMARVSLLIADDVGLGKTIEAALVMQEMITRQLVRRVMILCPASLQEQWREEMQSKFNLPFQIIDRQAVQNLRREYGVHINPWNSFPRLITSMDFLKREQQLTQFRASLEKSGAHAALRDWDLLIVDEVHNCAPAGRKQYAVDSDRTRMLREIAPHFEHRLFLTATPHNGFTESFTAILEMLDPDRFTRGPVLNIADRDRVMVRRLKDEITDALGGRVFPKREIPAIAVTLRDETVSEVLGSYVTSRMQRAGAKDYFAIQFALTMLKKRFLSSPLAFWRSLQTHMRFAGTLDEAADLGLVERMKDKVDEDWDDDDEKAQHEETALQEASRFFGDRTSDEIAWLKQLSEAAQGAHDKPDEKATALSAWIKEHLREGDGWGVERLIVFTEYKDTLEYLQKLLSGPEYKGRVLTLCGGMSSERREPIKAAFQTSPEDHPVRILLATDAASEGLNLQKHCRNLIHYEIPWNPVRMEQRNGRIDRHGQKKDITVYCHHFRYTNNADQQFLNVVVDKVQTQRNDLGSIGDVIAQEVEKAILGLTKTIIDPQARRERQEEELKSGVAADLEARRLHDRLLKTQQDLQLEPENLAAVLNEALRMSGHEGLRLTTDGDLAGKAFELRALPPSWSDCRSSLLNPKGHLLRLVFDHALAKDRNDVALIHLAHPLMKRALSVFRGCLWEQTGQTQLHRCSYRILPNRVLPDPAIVAFGRLVAVSQRGEKLHEALVHAGGWIKGHSVLPIEADLLRDLLSQPSTFSPIPGTLGERLRALFPAQSLSLEQMLTELEQAEAKRLKGLLDEKAKSVSQGMRQLIDERLKEIDKRLKDAQKEYEAAQLRLFDAEELGQVRWDLRWLEMRRDDLRERREKAPAAAAARYDLKNVRVFPLGLLYLLPQSLVEGGGH